MLLLLWACSATVPSLDTCESTQECQSVFGSGYTCGDEGYCEFFTPNDRCQNTIPADLYENWPKGNNYYVIGTMFNHISDEANLVAASLALEEAQDLPLEGTHNFVMIQCDYASTGDTEVNDVVRELSEHLSKEVGAKAVIGPAGSGASTIAFNATDDLLIISPSATSQTLSTIDGDTKTEASPGRFWRTVASDAIQARVLAKLVVMQERSNIGFVYENSVYGSDFIKIVEDEIASLGTISTNRYPYEPGDSARLGTQMQSAFSAGHDGFVVISAEIADLSLFLTTIAESPESFPDAQLFFADGAADVGFLEASSTLLGSGIQILGTRPPLLSGSLFNNFDALFSLKADEMGYSDLNARDNVYAAYTYDATWMALYGYAWAHFQDSPLQYEGLARGLRRLSDPNAEEIDITASSWNTIQAKFLEGTSVNVRGTSGKLDFNPVTEELDAPVEVWKIGLPYDCFSLLYTFSPTFEYTVNENHSDCPIQ